MKVEQEYLRCRIPKSDVHYPRFTPEKNKFYTESETPKEMYAELLDATVHITKEGNERRTGSGVIVQFGEKMFLLTAGHVLFPMLNAFEYSGFQKETVVTFKTPSGEMKTITLSGRSIIYQPKTATKKGFPFGDLAIARWTHECLPIEVSQLKQEDVDESTVLVGAGFPVVHKDMWEDSKRAILSFGAPKNISFLSKRGPYFDNVDSHICTEGGNSGGGVFLDNQLVGITSMGSSERGSQAILVYDILQRLCK